MVKVLDIPSKEVLQESFYLDTESPSGLRWKVARRKGSGIGYVVGFEGDVAGGKAESDSNTYWRVRLKGRLYLVHRLIWVMCGKELDAHTQIDHRNGNGLDNTYSNLRAVPAITNSQNSRMYKNNTSGVTGVSFRENSRGCFWIARWREEGIEKSKAFAVSVYGNTLAKALAIQHRKVMLEKLNRSGDDYTSRHGTKEYNYA